MSTLQPRQRDLAPRFNHCKPHFRDITCQHNAILDRIVKAYKPPAGTSVSVNKTVPGFADRLRPDLFIINESEKTASVIDVVTPFENRLEAFQAARREKRRKYDHIGRHFQQKGYNVVVGAFVVGALGGWDPENEPVIKRLRLGCHYCRLMKKLMCSDSIRWSPNIYIEHITNNRQNNSITFFSWISVCMCMCVCVRKQFSPGYQYVC